MYLVASITKRLNTPIPNNINSSFAVRDVRDKSFWRGGSVIADISRITLIARAMKRYLLLKNLTFQIGRCRLLNEKAKNIESNDSATNINVRTSSIGKLNFRRIK